MKKEEVHDMCQELDRFCFYLGWDMVDVSTQGGRVYLYMPDKEIEQYGLSNWPCQKRGDWEGRLVFHLREDSDCRRLEQLMRDSAEAYDAACEKSLEEDDLEQEFAELSEQDDFLDALEEERLAGFRPYCPTEYELDL